MPHLPRIVTPLVLLLSLSGCALLENQYKGSVAESPEPDEATAENGDKTAGGISRSAAELAQKQIEERDRVAPVLYRGTDRQFKDVKAKEPVKLIGDAASLNFEEAPLGEVLHAVMGEILGLDYIVDHPVQGKITLRSRTPIPRDQLLQVLESLLKANDVLMVRDEQGRYLITGSQQASRLSPEISSAQATGSGYSVIVVPLQYISAGNMAEILRPVAEESAFVRVDNVRNLLMLAGTQAQLAGWLDMVNTFDVDMLKGMSVGLFPLEHSGVEETAQVLNGMLSTGGEKGNFSQLVKIIPIKRLNSLLIVTPRAHYLDTVDTWIQRLDAAPDSNFAKRLYVYPVQNTTATRLADLLTNIYSGASGGSGGGAPAGSGSSFGQGGVAPGLGAESIGGGGLSAPDVFGGSGSGGEEGNTSKGIGGVAAMVDTGTPEIEDVRVVADDENNALMIYATGKQYNIIADALQQLDVVATQVIIEASILEVTLTDELKYGLEWTFKGGFGDDYAGEGQLSIGEEGIAALSGFSYTLRNSTNGISAVLNALASDSLVNVISTPSVMVLDNHEAYIHVGDQVPIEQGSLVSDGGVVTENYQYRDTGVKLTVKPSVNAGRLVTMNIEQSVTDIGGEAGIGGQPTFLERTISSRVAVRSDEAVVLGGLIRENASASDSGVPILHRLPVVGSLFGTTSNGSKRTELIVIITPRVIADETELRDVSRELRSRVRKMELIRGGVDQVSGSE
ncbi:type II secretion system secretin GspD [Parahaliea mediterranea]|uniref:Type II secretion system secretin GspD n=1 Tax=Parahaliea mediterranea TaxID=651086 RepID=A0A939DBL9_9GAMM|nr:type II secretion system secretin GspD [Parahaliea mediterranea]MBN7795171.1 type II secretion system secretin GspD [Parahaliea mediterranea]